MASLELFTLSLLAVVLISHQAVSISANVLTSNEYGLTEVQPERIVYDWTIRDFGLLPLREGQYINSTAFGTQNKDIEWRLRFYPRGISSADDYTALLVQPYSHNPTAEHMNIQVECTVSYVTQYKQRQFLPKVTHTYADVNGPGFPRFVQRSELVGYSSSDSILLQIRTEINIQPRIITGPMKKMTRSYPMLPFW